MGKTTRAKFYNIRYVDDTIFVAESEGKLAFLDMLVKVFWDKNLQLNKA